MILTEDHVPGTVSWIGRVAIYFGRGRGSIQGSGPCEANIFVNGALTRAHNIDDLIQTPYVVGVEVYQGAASVPPELTDCGVWIEGGKLIQTPLSWRASMPPYPRAR